ncbi:TPA: hypothetical protein BOS_9594 [Bos taurus]|nr:TPA: hypothetical protein BOS_9594 [Bos taurus]
MTYCGYNPAFETLGCRGYFDQRCQLPATASELAVTAAPLFVRSTADAQGGLRAGCRPLTRQWIHSDSLLGSWAELSGPA